MGEKQQDQDFSQVSLSPLLSPYEPLSSKGMKTIEHSIANLVFPQCCKAYAKEKGRVCLLVFQAHIFLKYFSSQLLQRKADISGQMKTYIQTSIQVIRSCGPKAMLTYLQPSARDGSFLHLPRLRLSPCPTREQINDFCSFDSVSKLSFNYKKTIQN